MRAELCVYRIECAGSDLDVWTPRLRPHRGMAIPKFIDSCVVGVNECGNGPGAGKTQRHGLGP